MRWELINGTIVNADKVTRAGSIAIDGDKIQKVSQAAKISSQAPKGVQIDLNGLVVFPGLINCHDHLLGTYVPRVGARKPYLNWLIWDNDLKSSPIYAERQQI